MVGIGCPKVKGGLVWGDRLTDAKVAAGCYECKEVCEHNSNFNKCYIGIRISTKRELAEYKAKYPEIGE